MFGSGALSAFLVCSLLVLLPADCSPVNSAQQNANRLRPSLQFSELRKTLMAPRPQSELMDQNEQGLRHLARERLLLDPDLLLLTAIMSARNGYEGRVEDEDENDVAWRGPVEELQKKRSKSLRLSLTNNIDVLREKLFAEIARRERMAHTAEQVEQANTKLTALG